MNPKQISEGLHAAAGMLRLLLAIVALPLLGYAKGGDGFIILKGTIQDVQTSGDAVTFAISGKLSFSFFTAAQGDPSRKRVDLEFDVKKLPVYIPKFGTAEYDASDDPFLVSFKNAAKHAVEASQSGESVTVALFTPRLSYNVSGVIEKAECAVAQIMPDRLERALHASGTP